MQTTHCKPPSSSSPFPLQAVQPYANTGWGYQNPGGAASNHMLAGMGMGMGNGYQQQQQQQMPGTGLWQMMGGGGMFGGGGPSAPSQDPMAAFMTAMAGSGMQPQGGTPPQGAHGSYPNLQFLQNPSDQAQAGAVGQLQVGQLQDPGGHNQGGGGPPDPSSVVTGMPLAEVGVIVMFYASSVSVSL